MDYEFSLDLFEKSNLKLIFGYVQNHHSYLDSATPDFLYEDSDNEKLMSFLQEISQKYQLGIT